MKLTQANVAKAKLPDGKIEQFFWDDEMPGFGLRIREGGSQTFVTQFKIGAKHRRMTLGNAGKVTAEEARRKAKQIFGKVADKIDPANERAVRTAEASATFLNVARDFLEHYQSQVRPRTYAEAERYLMGGADRPAHWRGLHALSLASIGRANVAAEAQKIAKANGPIAADRARAALSSFFAWAVAEGLCNLNPVTGTKSHAPKNGGERARRLTDSELAAIWKAAPDNDYGRIVKLLMLTGCRRNEIGNLKRHEIDSEGRVIALAGERTKNGEPHDVPLSKPALAIVEGVERQAGRDFVFGRGKGGFAGWSKAKQELDEMLSIGAWRLHDLRHTFATRCGDLGVLPHVIEAALNHISGHKAGIAGLYNRSTYAKEKKAALDTWGNHVMVVLVEAEGGNVQWFARR